MESLQSGEVVGVFPEATMSRSFEPKAFKTGAVRMADEAGVPLVPMALWGTQRLWCYDRRSSMKQYGVPVEIHVGEPVDPSGDPEQATARLRESIIDLVGQGPGELPRRRDRPVVAPGAPGRHGPRARRDD